MEETVYDLCPPSVLTTTWKKKKVQVFPSSGLFFRCVTEKIKVIKTQAEPNQSYFPKESFDKRVKCNRT